MIAKRNYTALKDGKAVRRGTFNDEKMLRLDFPADEYELLLDVFMELDAPAPTYAELRRQAYPTDGDFADAIYWQAKGDSSKMDAYIAKVDAVKARFPKV